MNEIIKDPYYNLLVEDCKAIVTEAVFISRWSLVEGYHQLGHRIVTDENYQEYAKGNQGSLKGLSKNIGIGERTLYYATRFYKKYPVLNDVPEGKNISWNKLITKYLPEKVEEDQPNEIEKITKGIERWEKAIDKSNVNSGSYNRIMALVAQIKKILEEEQNEVGPDYDLEPENIDYKF